MRTARNIAIIAGLAAVIAFAPAGSNAFSAVMVALTIAFLSAIAWTVWRFAERNELTLDSLSDRDRALLYGAVGAVVLLFAGTDRFFSSGLGTVLWILLLAGAGLLAWRVWRQANTY